MLHVFDIKFMTRALNDPKMTLRTTRSRLHHISSTRVPRVLNFSPFRSTASRFLSYKPFWDKCTELLKMTLNTIRIKLPHIWSTRTPNLESKIWLHFALLLTISNIFAIFISPLATVLNFNVFVFIFLSFKILRRIFVWLDTGSGYKRFGWMCRRNSILNCIFGKNASAPTEWPEMTLNTTRSKVQLLPTSPHFNPLHPTIVRLPDNWRFWLPCIVQWWMWNFRKNKIVVNGELKIWKYREEQSGQNWKKIAAICRRSILLNFHSHWVPC